MKYQCDRITDEIWERAGEDLPADIAEHVAACPDCERVADEARKLLPMVQAASCVPDAPDCRSAVMERISPRPATRPIWAYALASIVLAAVILTGLLTLRPGPQQTVRDPRPEVRVQSPMPTPEVRKPIPEPTIVRQVPEHKPEAKRPKRIHAPKESPAQLVKQALKQEPAVGGSPAPSPEVVSWEDEPVAAVAVTWPGNDPQPGGWSGYTNVNTTTGEVTVCRTERTGNSVTIYLETKAPGEKPGKGA